MKDFAAWTAFCPQEDCRCTRPDAAPCDEGFVEGHAWSNGEMPRCSCCGWPEVSHVGAEQRERLMHPWHIEATLRAALSNPELVVRRLHDTLRGDPRFVVETPDRLAVTVALAVPDRIAGCVLIEPRLGRP